MGNTFRWFPSQPNAFKIASADMSMLSLCARSIFGKIRRPETNLSGTKTETDYAKNILDLRRLTVRLDLDLAQFGSRVS
jgi:hypothetical protein